MVLCSRAGVFLPLTLVALANSFVSLCAASQTVSTSLTLENGFRSPPVSAKPHTWWHWMNGNISKAGITADLEAMKRIGIGGAQIFNVDVGFPDGKAPMMSKEWSEDIQFAIKEAHRLGMDLCIHNGGGWSSSGGPWIKPDQGMQFLTWSETGFKGPGRFEGRLPLPATKEASYHDIAVYAMKRPSDEANGAGFRLENIRIKAAFERGDRIDPTDTAAPPDAVTPTSDVQILTRSLPADGSILWDAPAGDWVIMRMGYTPTGETNHPAPLTGRGLECDKLSRAALDTHWAGMMGPIVKEAGKLAGTTLNDCLIDSYEVGTQNWSPQFREEFQKRRGYDPLPYLPVVSGRVIESTEVSERFLWDLRHTICDLFSDNYYGYLADICHNNGLIFSTEPYGNGEFNNLQIGGDADIPMGEFWVGNGAIETTKLASSAGHIYGHPIIGAESFTADTPHARWTMDPYGMKALGDSVFTLGVNRFIFHRYAHQPWMNLRPGMTMGPWGTNLERTITWWEQGAAWMHYLARCQYLLQSGKFVADVAYFIGDDAPNDVPMLKGNAIPEGYDYDGIDSTTLQKFAVKDGRLTLPSGTTYRVLVLPESKWMTPESARKIRDLVAAGATIFGRRFAKSPSLNGFPKCDSDVTATGDELWGASGGVEQSPRAVGKGQVYWGKPIAEILPEIAGAPDCDLVSGRPKSMVWIHRHTDDGDVYFVSNQRYQPEEFTIAFRQVGKSPELWNPQTGAIFPAPVWRVVNGKTYVTLQMSAADSVFVVFRSPAKSPHIAGIELIGERQYATTVPVIIIESARYEAVDGAGGADVKAKVAEMVREGATTIEATNENFGDPTSLHVKRLHVVYMLDGKRFDKTVGENEELTMLADGSDVAIPDYQVETRPGSIELLPWHSGIYKVEQADGTSRTVQTRGPQKFTVVGPWNLSFPPKLGAPATAVFDKLISWPDSADPGIKYFSGSATYETTVIAPENLVDPHHTIYLDLGTVKNIAEVWLNGKQLGTFWKPPFRLDVSKMVHPGHNSLRVRITNLWPNRIIGDEQLPSDVEWNGEVIKAWPQWLIDGKPRPPTERITFTTWRVFSKDSSLYPAGLIGPVQLISVERVRL